MLRPLQHITTEALLDELQRRREGAKHLKLPENWCNDCAHWRAAKSLRDENNCCSKSHSMEFVMPADDGYPVDGEWGHYRRDCPDWADHPAPAEVRPARGGQPMGVA